MDRYCGAFEDKKYIKTLKAGIMIPLCGLFVSSFLPVNVSILSWTASLISLLLLAGRYGNRYRRDVLEVGLISIIFQLVSVLAFNSHLLDSANSLGTNANLFSWLLYVLILGAAATGRHRLTGEGIDEIMHFLLNRICVTAAVVLVMDLKKLPAVLSGSFNSYTAAMWGFFPNKNMFGMVCALGIVAGSYCIFTKKQLKPSAWKCAFLLLMLVLSFSRAAWLFAAVFIASFFLQMLRAKSRKARIITRRLFLVFVFAAGIVLVTVLGSTGLRNMVMTNFLRLDIGDAGRSSIQQTLLSEFKSRGAAAAVFGIGYSEYSFLCSIDVHNGYLYTLVTGGVLKLAALFILILFSIKTNRRCGNALIRHCGTGTLTAYLVLSLFETYEPFEVGFANMILFFFILLFPMLQRGNEGSRFMPE